MLNTRDHIQNRQQQLFGKLSLASKATSQTQQGLNTAQPFQYAQNSISNQAYLHTRLPADKINVKQSINQFRTLNIDASQNQKQFVNKYQRINSDIGKNQRQTIFKTSFNQKNYINKKNLGFQSYQINDSRYVTGGLKRGKRTQVKMSSQDDYQVSGSVEYHIEDNYQDKYFGPGNKTGQNKLRAKSYSRVRTIQMSDLLDPAEELQKLIVQQQANPWRLALDLDRPPLPFPMNGLEPSFSEDYMLFYYEKHQGDMYRNLNTIMLQDFSDLKKGRSIPNQFAAIKANGGGAISYDFVWQNLCPVAESVKPSPDSQLGMAIDKAFGSLQKFQDLFDETIFELEQSELMYGWGWLVYNKTTDALEIVKTLGHGFILADQPNLVPLMAIDVYFQKDDYNFVSNMWHIMNWKTIADRLEQQYQFDQLAKITFENKEYEIHQDWKVKGLV